MGRHPGVGLTGQFLYCERMGASPVSQTGAGANRDEVMSDCLHCDIHDLLDPHLQSEDANLSEVTAKVTEVLADLILLAPPDERSILMADVLANLGEFVLQKADETVAGQASSRRH